MADDGDWFGAAPAAASPKRATPAPWMSSAPVPPATSAVQPTAVQPTAVQATAARSSAPPAAASWAAPGAPWATGPVPDDDREPSSRRGALPWVLGALSVGAVAMGGYFVADALFSEPAASSSADAGVYGAAPEQEQATEQEPEASAVAASPTAATPTTAAPSGPAVVLEPVSVTATCQASPGVDSSGAAVTYEPQHTLDFYPDTAWRCPGSAIGAQLTFSFSGPVTIATVGLVPGYAKIDPADGTQRFTENRTVTAVTWRYENGTFAQQIPAPTSSMTDGRLPTPVQTDRIVLEISGTGNDGAVRDFTAISDVRFTGHPAGSR